MGSFCLLRGGNPFGEAGVRTGMSVQELAPISKFRASEAHPLCSTTTSTLLSQGFCFIAARNNSFYIPKTKNNRPLTMGWLFLFVRAHPYGGCC